MTGLEGRATLLANLSKALRANPVYFGDDARPGNLIGNLHSVHTINFLNLCFWCYRFFGISIDC